MDVFECPTEMIALASTILLMFLSTHRALELPTIDDNEEEVVIDFHELWQTLDRPALDMDAISRAALHSIQLWNTLLVLDEELGYWVKSRSTTWFSRFLLDQYDEARWLKMFRFSKPSVFSLAEVLKPTIMKKDTKYRLAIPVVVRLACTLFKLTHSASLLICSEMFAVSRSTVSMLLRDVVHAINIHLRSEMSWPRGEKLRESEQQFRQLCGFPGVAGAIDATHISISKPVFVPADYYHFKSGSYTMHCQAVVDSRKRFLDLFIGMPRSTNDSRALRRSTLFHKASDNTLWDAGLTFQGFSPYLLGDLGYPLHPWLLVPHRQHGQMAMADSLFNRKLRRGRCVVENSFGLLKQSFRELLLKSDLDVTFMPDVIMCCALLHNLLQRQSTAEVERLLDVLRTEGYNDNVEVDEVATVDGLEVSAEDQQQHDGLQKRRDLGLFLALQRVPQN